MPEYRVIARYHERESLPTAQIPTIAGLRLHTEWRLLHHYLHTHKQAHWFGHIADGVMLLNRMGHIAADCWAAIPDHFATVELDAAVVMPDHVHGIIVLEGGTVALGTIIGIYKAAVTRQIRRECTKPPSIIWHGRHHDRIIRNGRALEQIREYILYNPMRRQAK